MPKFIIGRGQVGLRATDRVNIILAGESSSGLVRKHNEDSFCLICQPSSRAALAVVADGVGGYSRGEIASFICCRDLSRRFLDCGGENWDSPTVAAQFFHENIGAINDRIYQRNSYEQRPRPMASTIIAIVFFHDSLVMASAGDSRLYELDGEGNLSQLSQDHTLSAELYQKFGKNPEFLSDGHGEMITRVVGSRAKLDLDVKTFERKAKSRYLLCTDGLYRDISTEQLIGELKSAASPRRAVGALVRAALLGGGHDNITALAAFP